MEEWLRSIGLGERIAAFRAHAIASEQLRDLTEADLRELGLPIGERKRFRQALELLGGQIPEAARAERRPLTMMFVDMVGSSRLSELQEPEDQIELLQAYRTLCGGIVERFGGHIARVVGDGILAYFCYPVANENDPERAVRAGTAIARDVGSLSRLAPLPVQVRIGIATGRVIVSDLFAGSREADRRSIVGATPNLAARLQSLAPPGDVVVADETYARVRHRFACDDLGVRELHGFETKHRAWRVTGELPIATHGAGPRPMTPFFGRGPERASLSESWNHARAGRGGTTLLIGEAGIGKSRLVEEFLGSVAPTGGDVLRLAASILDQDSPLHPAIAYLRAVAGITTAEPADRSRGKLAAVLLGDADQVGRALPILARLLDLPPPDGEPLEALTPEQLRERTLSVLVDQMAARAARGPFCLVIEDLHWLDPTSHDLLARLIEHAAGLPMLVLATARDGFDASWMASPEARVIRLARLEAEAVLDMMRSLFAGRELPADMARMVARRTDGVPLFVEEVARSLLTRDGPALVASGDVDEAAGLIPASLQAALMARLDRSGPAKQMAQIASVVGRTASRAMLDAVANLRAAEMDDALHVLVGSGLLFRDDAQGQEAYTFSHALIRDAAYDTQLRDRRRALHLAIARALPELDAATVEQRPELLALHLTEAGEADDAAPLWEQAARRGLARSALAEATRLLRRGLAALEACEPTDARRMLRIRLQTLLGPALITLHGLGSMEALDLYHKALATCRELPDSPDHFPIYWGAWLATPEPRDKRARAASLLDQARGYGEPGLLLEAHHCSWASAFLTANFDECLAHAHAGLTIYETGDFADHGHSYGTHDPKVCAHCCLTHVFWMRGQLRSAAAQDALAQAWLRKVGHLGTDMYALNQAMVGHTLRRQFQGALTCARKVVEVCDEHGLQQDSARASIYLGWATAMTTDAVGGLRMIDDGRERLRDISVPIDEPLFACLHAEALGQIGDYDAADTMLTQETARSVEMGLRVWLPEMLRMRAETLMAASATAIAEPAALLAEAAGIVDEQGARMLGLRVAISMAHLDARQGDTDAGARRIRAALRHIPEDDGGPELVRAGQLAQAWRQSAGCA